MRIIILRFACAAVLALTFAMSAAAQTGATLRGTVTDPSGAAVAGAEITVQPMDARGAGVGRATTDAAGKYSLALAAGRYRVRIAAPAAPALARVERDVMLAAGESLEWNVRLELERLSATVVVTAHAEPLAADSSGAALSAVNSETIARRQWDSLARALEAQPGVSIGRNGREGGIASLFVNGGNSNFTKVLVDGVPLNEPGGAVDLSNFRLENVEKIELVRGAESALLGTDAMSGAVQVFTRRGTTRVPELRLLAEGGRFGTARGAADLSGIIGAFDYSLGAARFETGGAEANDVFRVTTLSGNFGWRVNEAHRVRLALRSASSHAGVPGQTVYQPSNLDQYNGLRNFTASLAWDFSAGRRWKHRIAATESYIRQLFDNPTSDFCDPNPPFLCDFAFTARNQFNRTGAGAQSSFTAPAAAVTFGFQTEIENGWLDARHVRRNNHDGFVDARWQPAFARSRLTLTGGFRLAGNDAFGTRAVPRVGASYVVRQGGGFWGATRLRGTFGLGVKEPSFVQSFGFSTDPCFPGNLNLRPEKSRAVNAGVEQLLAGDRVKISAAGFYNRFRDIASFTFCVPGGPCPVPPAPGCPFGFGTFFNTDLARAYGTNLGVEAKLTRWLFASGNYSLVESRVLEAPNAFDPALVPGQRLFRRPVHSGNFVLSGGGRRLSASFSGYFVGPRTDSDFLGLGFTRNPGYAKFDLTANFEVQRNVTAFARIENLFDKRYQENLGYRALRRGAYGGLRFRFGGD